MIKTINLTADISADRDIRVVLPAEVVIVIASRNPEWEHTLKDIAESEIFGMWSDRTDIEDSENFARHLRDKGWTRNSS